MKITNEQMQELCNNAESYCPIDNAGNLQPEVNDNTMYIVDVDGDPQGKHHKEEENELMCIMDRDGENFYAVKVNPWW